MNFGIKGLLGFGCMRLPMKGEEVDTEEFSRMIDHYLACGFNYFDTAHGYIDGKSETALKECLTDRYPRESYMLTNKLSFSYFQSEADIRPFFESQLELCGVDYFDFYLMHAQNRKAYEKYKSCRAYETALALRDEGKIKHFGISFHDKADVLDRILTDYPQIEAVQLQFNYLDYEDKMVESRLCYEVARKHEKAVIIMEPVKGGKLSSLTDEARCPIDALGNGMSPASYAIRFAAGFEGVISVLSGMGSMDMMVENTGFMENFVPLNKDETEAVFKVRDIIKAARMIDCTGCRYCVEVCPGKIETPSIFACMNNKKMYKDWMPEFYYNLSAEKGSSATDCISCGKCEDACPQHLPIRKLLSEAVSMFEKK